MELPKYLKIHLEGGIGDCLKVLTCNFPLRSLYEQHQVQTFVTYGGKGYNDAGWGEILKKEIIDQTDHLIDGDGRKDPCPDVQDFFDNNPLPHLEKLLPLLLNSQSPTPIPSKKCRNIAVQLDSNDPRKKLPLKKWNELIQRILNEHKHTHLYIIDAPSRKEIITSEIDLSSDRVSCTAGNSLSQTIHLLSQMDLVIAPDSFSKYICLCHRIPGIILCAELSYMTVSDMLLTCFGGIHDNDNFKLLGLGASPVQNINEINTNEILQHIA